MNQLIGKFGRLEEHIHQLSLENEQLKINVDRMAIENHQFTLELKQIKSDKSMILLRSLGQNKQILFTGKRDTTARTCAELKLTDPSFPSEDYYIDPDGVNVGENPILVHCDMVTGINQLYK